MPHAKVGDIELCYEVRGELSSESPPLLLIMGLGAQMISWDDALCDLLVERGFTVIRFDNRDVGLSTKLDHLGRPRLRSMFWRGLINMPGGAPYSLNDMAADALGLLDALDISSAHVVGASMGGMIAQCMALDAPHRVRSLTSIMSHPGDTRSKISKPAAMRTLFTPLPRDRELAIARQVEILRLLSSPAYPFDAERARRLIERGRERSYHPPGFLRQMSAIVHAPNRIPALRKLRVPSLVMHGRNDILVPVIGGKSTARAIPGARLRIFDGMGHDLPRPLWPVLVDEIARHADSADAAHHATPRAASV
ncbi:MAG: alpha/beta hydrolase [Haliangiales bacterium]